MSENDTPNTMAKPARSPLPDFADIVYLLIVALLVLTIPNFVLGDGSTGWHLYTGKYILESGRIPTHDLFSYTFPDKAWVPYEWLFDLVGAGLVKIGGMSLFAVIVDCSLAFLFSLVLIECRKERCHFALCVVFSILGILASTIHWLARPHIVTFFGVLIYSRALERYRRGDISAKRLWLWIALPMIIWANAHPAFLIGLGLIAIYLVCETTIALVSGEPDLKKAAWQRSGTLAIAFVLAVLASFLNANGAQLHAYIFEYLHRSSILSVTHEFTQPNLRQLHAICMLLLMFAFVLGLLISKRKLGLSPFMMVVAFSYLGLTSMRNEPLFVLVALPVIAWLYAEINPLILTGFPEMQPSNWFARAAAFFKRTGETVDSVETSCNMHLLPIIVTVGLVIACLMGSSMVAADFDPKNKPSQTLEAMMRLPEQQGFNLDNWGGYIVYKTGRRVFIDDRLDFYGEKFYFDYGHIVSLNDNWQQLLDKHKINWVLMPPKSLLISRLKTLPDWRIEAEDPASVLMVRKTPI